MPYQYLFFIIGSAYHGHVISLIDVSPYKFAHPGGEGQPDWVHVVSCLLNISEMFQFLTHLYCLYD